MARSLSKRAEPTPEVVGPLELVPSEDVVRPKVARQMLGNPANSTFWKWVRDGEFEVIRIGPNFTLLTVRSLYAFRARHTVEAA